MVQPSDAAAAMLWPQKQDEAVTAEKGCAAE